MLMSINMFAKIRAKIFKYANLNVFKKIINLLIYKYT